MNLTWFVIGLIVIFRIAGIVIAADAGEDAAINDYWEEDVDFDE